MANQWRDEVYSVLNGSPLYQRLGELVNNDAANQALLTLVNVVCYDAYQRSKLVLQHMGEYTLHDGVHLFNVLRHMAQLIPEETLSRLSSPELAVLILAAFLHDIGMCPPESDVRIWKSILVGEASEEEKACQPEFIRFCDKHQNRIQLRAAKESGNVMLTNSLIGWILADWIRQGHADRAARMIREEWGAKLRYRDFALGPLLARICASHGRNARDLLKDSELAQPVLVGPGEYVNAVFLAVVLRLADLIDFDASRTPAVLFDNLVISDPISLKEWEKHRAVEAWDIRPEYLAFSARCVHPAIEKTIREFLLYIKKELIDCQYVLDRMVLPYGVERDRYEMRLPQKIEKDQIKPAEDEHGRPLYRYKDLSFTLNQDKIMHLLMGTNLYGNSSLALRELLQNAIDTCRFRSIKEKSWGRTQDYEPRITVELGQEEGREFLEITDNGMGMDLEIIENFFANVGSSYYRSGEFQAELEATGGSFSPISKFGIGFLSTFMITDEMHVETRRLIDKYQLGEPLRVKITGGHKGLFWIQDGMQTEPGTKIRLYLKEGHPFQNDKLGGMIREIVPHVEIPIRVVTDSPEEEIVDGGFRVTEKWDQLQNDPNIRTFLLDINEPNGLRGIVLCAFVVEDTKPLTFTDVVELNTTGVQVDGEYYKFHTYLRLQTNEISESRESLDVQDGLPEMNEGFSSVVHSQGRLSIKGIAVPQNIFTAWFSDSRAPSLRWPFPVYYDLDASGDWELNLTASRDRIVLDEQWKRFQRNLADVIARALVEKMGRKGLVDNLLSAIDRVYGADKHLINALRAAAEERFS